MHTLAFSHSGKAHERNKESYDRKTVEREYSPGDAVFLYREVVRRGEYHKFVRPWKPAEVLSKVGDLNYRIKVKGSRKILTVHHNRLKPRLVHAERAEPVSECAESAERSAQGSQEVTGRFSRVEVADGLVWSPNPEMHFSLPSISKETHETTALVPLRRSACTIRPPDYHVP